MRSKLITFAIVFFPQYFKIYIKFSRKLLVNSLHVLWLNRISQHYYPRFLKNGLTNYILLQSHALPNLLKISQTFLQHRFSKRHLSTTLVRVRKNVRFVKLLSNQRIQMRIISLLLNTNEQKYIEKRLVLRVSIVPYEL